MRAGPRRGEAQSRKVGHDSEGGWQGDRPEHGRAHREPGDKPVFGGGEDARGVAHGMGSVACYGAER